MSNFIKFFKKPIVWVYVSIIYIWLFSVSILIATIGPTFVIAKIADRDHSISLADLKMAFLTYVQEGSKRLNYDYNYMLYAHIFNLAIYPPAIMIGFFVLRKSMWARNAMIALIVILLLYPIMFNLLFFGLTFNIDYFNTLIYLCMIIFFSRKNTKAIFLRDDTNSGG